MANGNYYLGQEPGSTIDGSPRFFYGLRRNENGSLFLQKIDQIKDKDIMQINEPGDPTENFTDFEPGVDFFEGLTVNHEPVFDNLKYQQYRWDNRPAFYYVNDEGELVVRINQGYTYTDLDSED